MTTETKEPLFRDIDADEGENVNTIESLCMSCEENVSCNSFVVTSNPLPDELSWIIAFLLSAAGVKYRSYCTVQAPCFSITDRKVTSPVN